jgi:predicted MFS family arabinose efflux permease
VSSVSSVVASLGRTVVLVGLAIAGLGLLMMLGVPFGRLPGDFYVRRGSFSFYFPLATSIILSIILTLVFALFRR